MGLQAGSPLSAQDVRVPFSTPGAPTRTGALATPPSSPTTDTFTPPSADDVAPTVARADGFPWVNGLLAGTPLQSTRPAKPDPSAEPQDPPLQIGGGDSPIVEPRSTPKHQWIPQASVYAAAREDQLASGANDNPNYYTHALIDQINNQRPGQTLDDAARALSGKPGPGLGSGTIQHIPAGGPPSSSRQGGQPGTAHFTDNQNPVSSAGSQASNSWKKNVPGQETTTPRYAILIGGQPDPSSHKPGQSEQQMIDNNLHDMEAALRTNYGNEAARDGGNASQPGSRSNLQIDTLRAPSDAQLQAALKRARTFTQSHPGAEVMIYYSGHGGLAKDRSGQPLRQAGVSAGDQQQGLQGSSEGELYPRLPAQNGQGPQPLTADRLKDLVRQYLSGSKSLAVVLDACQSGSFAA